MKKKYIMFFILFFAMQSNIFSQIASLEKTLEIKNVSGFSVPYQNGIPLTTFEKQNRKMFDLSGTWKKERTAADDNITLAKRDSTGYQNLINESAGKYLVDYNDSAWEEKQIPSVENKMNEYPNAPEFFKDGVWYRRQFFIDEEDSAKFAKLNFISVNYVADVWINGKYLGYHEGGYTPFAFDVSSFLNYGDTNTIAVRVDVINWGARIDVIPHKQVDWFNYGGIIQDVYIEFSNPISVVRTDIIPTDLDGNLKAKVVIQNRQNLNSDVSVNLKVYEAVIDSFNISTEFTYELTGEEINISGQNNFTSSISADSIEILETNISIANPKIWSPKNPNLYIMKVSVYQNEYLLDEYTTQFGIRTVKTSENKFLLNDRIMFLTGTARHEDHPVYGRSLPKEIIYNDLKLVKSLNINFLRTAHYPNHPYTYLILDRLGITAMEEIPLWQVDTDEPWQIQNNDRKMHLQMFREMVYKEYNRPSVIMWSMSNECHEETNRMIYNQMVKDDFEQNYDDGRLISQSPAADNPGPTDVTQSLVDIAGWTMYFGIFHGSTYFGGTYNFINLAKTSFPEKPILDTEFGYWSSENNSTIQDQVTVADETFKAFKIHAALNQDGTVNKAGSLMACTWWCIFDWYTAGIPRGYQSMGLFTMDRQTEKPVAQKIKTLYYPYFDKEGVLTSINEKKENLVIPKTFELKQNYPNPFNPNTVVEYSVPEKSKIKISLFNVIGQEVIVLVDSTIEKGNHKLNINAGNLSSGIYFIRMNAVQENSKEIQKTIKLSLLK
ncbi:MAG: T9SS type A sorting domain-containing protein [Ignavibacteriae bacterium]|nr:T9SS type A sorting domain-containing protein [Ignavibacteriota bacterium]